MEPCLVDLFSGAGGSCMGLKLAGFDVRLAVEWDDHAAACYRLNFPETPLYHGDVGKLSDAEALRVAGVTPRELDVMSGSPPCQGFSSAGSRNLCDDRNVLFREYVRLLRAFMPKSFVMENVPGLLVGKMKLVFLEVMRELRESGYRVKCAVLDASAYGVPQRRRRAIFIGVREDLGVDPAFPDPTSARASTVAEALGAAVGWRLADPAVPPGWLTPGGTAGGDIYALGGSGAGEVMCRADEPARPLLKGALGGPEGQAVWNRSVGIAAAGSPSGSILQLARADKPGELSSGGEYAQAITREGTYRMARHEAGLVAPVEGALLFSSGMNADDPPADLGAGPGPTLMKAGIAGSAMGQAHVIVRGSSPMSAVLPAPALTGKAKAVADALVTARDMSAVLPAPPFTGKVLRIAEALAEGQDGSDLPFTNGGFFGNSRLDRAQPSLTITKNCGLYNRYPNVRHFEEVRGLSVGEVMRLQSFPDDYRWPEGTKWADGWARVGNSVPPLMMRAVGRKVRVLLGCPLPDGGNAAAAGQGAGVEVEDAVSVGGGSEAG